MLASIENEYNTKITSAGDHLVDMMDTYGRLHDYNEEFVE